MFKNTILPFGILLSLATIITIFFVSCYNETQRYKELMNKYRYKVFLHDGKHEKTYYANSFEIKDGILCFCSYNNKKYFHKGNWTIIQNK